MNKLFGYEGKTFWRTFQNIKNPPEQPNQKYITFTSLEDYKRTIFYYVQILWIYTILLVKTNIPLCLLP